MASLFALSQFRVVRYLPQYEITTKKERKRAGDSSK
jgi:hypothetical protein